MDNPMTLSPNSLTCLCASSGAGKSEWVIKLVLHAREVYNNEFDAIIWCYQAGETSVPRDRLKHIPNIQFHKGLPPTFSSFPRNSLIICDDCSNKVINAESIYRAAIMGSHHDNQTLVLVCHQIFAPGKNFKAVSRQCHYYVLMRSPRDRNQVDIFFRQIEPKRWRELREVYESEVVAKPFNYLIIDCHPATNSNVFKFKNNIFPTDIAGQFFCSEEDFNSISHGEEKNEEEEHTS